LIGYHCWTVLCPLWNWRWALPQADYQKFLGASLLAGCILTGFRGNRLSGVAGWSAASLWAYLGISFISLTQSIDPPKSQWYMDYIWKIVLMSFVGTRILDRPRFLVPLSIGLVVAQGWNAYNINELYFTNGFINTYWFTWNFYDNNLYSISSLPIMAIAVGMAFCAESMKLRVLAGSVFVLQMHQLMLLESRGTMLGGLLLASLSVLFMPKNRWTWTCVISGVVVGSILAGPPVIKEFTSAFAKDGERDSSAESRFYLWEAGAKIMADNPILGVGPWASEAIVGRYYMDGNTGITRKALHNLFFEIGCGSGVFALGFFLFYFWSVWFVHLGYWWWGGDRPDWFRWINVAILCGIPGFWCASMFSSGGAIEAPYILVSLGAASIPAYERWARDAEFDLEQMDSEPLSG
jgi:hypothetical protein